MSRKHQAPSLEIVSISGRLQMPFCHWQSWQRMILFLFLLSISNENRTRKLTTVCKESRWHIDYIIKYRVGICSRVQESCAFNKCNSTFPDVTRLHGLLIKSYKRLLQFVSGRPGFRYAEHALHGLINSKIDSIFQLPLTTATYCQRINISDIHSARGPICLCEIYDCFCDYLFYSLF